MPINKNQLTKLHDYLWELPKKPLPDMLVPARVYAFEELLTPSSTTARWNSLPILTLPGIVKAFMVMPDVHEGYGFPIEEYCHSVIRMAPSLGGIGYDINCGVRLLISDLTYNQVKKPYGGTPKNYTGRCRPAWVEAAEAFC